MVWEWGESGVEEGFVRGGIGKGDIFELKGLGYVLFE